MFISQTAKALSYSFRAFRLGEVVILHFLKKDSKNAKPLPYMDFAYGYE